MKLYSVKSSAVRAAKAAGLTQYEIIEQEGQYGFRPVKPEAQKRTDAKRQRPTDRKKATTTVASVSTIESPVRRVWEIADSMPDAKRKDVVGACVEQGIAFYTARTQYQKWRQNQAT